MEEDDDDDVVVTLALMRVIMATRRVVVVTANIMVLLHRFRVLLDAALILVRCILSLSLSRDNGKSLFDVWAKYGQYIDPFWHDRPERGHIFTFIYICQNVTPAARGWITLSLTRIVGRAVIETVKCSQEDCVNGAILIETYLGGISGSENTANNIYGWSML
jgi:hypothetical protein